MCVWDETFFKYQQCLNVLAFSSPHADHRCRLLCMYALLLFHSSQLLGVVHECTFSLDIISRQRRGRKMTCICMEWWFSMDDLKLIEIFSPCKFSVLEWTCLPCDDDYLNTPIERKEFSSFHLATHSQLLIYISRWKSFSPQNRKEEEGMMARCYV